VARSTYIVTTNDLPAAVNENAQFLMVNVHPHQKLRITQFTTSTCVSSTNNIFRFYANPVVDSLGTPLSYPGNSAMRCYITPVVQVANRGIRFMTVNQGPTSNSSTPVDIDLEPGKSILVTVRPNTTGSTFALTVQWVE
jgi:hypothetical protein